MTEPRLARSSFNPGYWLYMLVGLAIGMRVWLAVSHPYVFPDSADYQTLALRLLRGESYEVGGNVASRMPGYPLLVAVVYGLVQPSMRAVLILQALMGGAVVWLVYAIARRAAGGGQGEGGARQAGVTALVAAGLAAADPLSVGFSAAFLTEIPFTFCMMLGLWIAVRLLGGGEGGGAPRRAWLHWVALGLVWGAGVYLRVSALWAIVPLGLWTGWCWSRASEKGGGGKRWARGIGGAVIAIGVVFVLLAPWLVRNYRIFHSGPMRLTTLEGISLYEAVYPSADGGPKQDKIATPLEMSLMNEAARNDEWARRGWAYVIHDPVRIAKLGVRKIGRTWSPWFNPEGAKDSGASGALQRLITAWYVPLYVLALLGLFAGGSGGGSESSSPVGVSPFRIKVLLLIPVVYFTLVHALFLGSVRYRVPLMPIACIFAALGLVRLWRTIRRS